MSEERFPVDKWGNVSGSPTISKVRVERSRPAGFVILTKEAKGTFDVWVETEDDVLDFLKTLDVRW